MAPLAGSCSAAAMPAGRAKAMLARPLEISRSRGSSHSQKAVVENMCAPASTVTRGRAPVSRATSCASRTTRGGVTPCPPPLQASAVRIRARCAAISSARQALRGAPSASAAKAGAGGPYTPARGVV
jgi:hypothetical protein